jgi:enamidase
MAVEVSNAPLKGKLVITGISLMLSGDLDQPILDADTIIAIAGALPP